MRNGFFQLVRLSACHAQRAPGIAFAAGECHQYAVLRHKGIAGAIRLFLGIAQDAHDIGGEAWLRGSAAAGHFRQAGDIGFNRVLGANRITPGSAD